MGPIGCPVTSVWNYHCMLRSNPEELRSRLLRGGSLKSRTRNLLSYRVRTVERWGCRNVIPVHVETKTGQAYSSLPFGLTPCNTCSYEQDDTITMSSGVTTFWWRVSCAGREHGAMHDGAVANIVFLVFTSARCVCNLIQSGKFCTGLIFLNTCSVKAIMKCRRRCLNCIFTPA
jgi:hypothetical protein